MEAVLEQCHTKTKKYGEISDIELLQQNLKENCIPKEVFNMDVFNYEEFLEKRRSLMAQKIKEFYYSL
jgi:hypothetical protein